MRSVGMSLVAVSLASIAQSIHEFVLWETGNRRYEETHLLERAFTFAGHVFTLQDSHPYLPREPDSFTSEVGYPGTVQLLMDGVPLGTPARATVRPGRDDLGRYHLWFDAIIFTDRRTGESSLWMARRIQEEEGNLPSFEVITVGADGDLITRHLRTYQLSRSYPVFRTSQFLRGSSFFAVPLSVLDAFMFPPFLLLFPVGTLLVGVWLTWRGERRRRAPVAA